MDLSIILFIVALLIVIEGAFIAFSPKESARLMRAFRKNLKRLRWVGIIEFIIGLVLMVVVIVGRSS